MKQWNVRMSFETADKQARTLSRNLESSLEQIREPDPRILICRGSNSVIDL